MQEVLDEVNGMPEKSYKKGDVIFEEGKCGSVVYILKDGSVSISTAGNEICKVNIPGTMLGEVSALLEGDYSATVRALSDTTFYVIDDLQDLFRKKPEVCLNVARLLALRLINMNHHFAEIKHEILQMRANATTKEASNKLYLMIQKMDEFWGRDVINPFSKKK